MLSKRLSGFVMVLVCLFLLAVSLSGAEVLCDMIKLRTLGEASCFNEAGEMTPPDGAFMFPAKGNINAERGCVEFEFKPNWTSDPYKRDPVTLFTCWQDKDNNIGINLRGVDLYATYTVAGKRNIYLYSGLSVKAGEWYRIVFNYDSRNKILDDAQFISGMISVNGKPGFQLEQGARFKPMSLEKASIGFGFRSRGWEAKLDAQIRNVQIYDSCHGVQLHVPPEYELDMSSLRLYTDVHHRYIRDFIAQKSDDDSPVRFDFSYGNSLVMTLPQARTVRLLKISVNSPKEPDYPLADSFGLYAADNEAWYQRLPILAVKEEREADRTNIWFKVDCTTRFLKLYNQDSSVPISLPEVEVYEHILNPSARQSGLRLAEYNDIHFWSEHSLGKVMRDDLLPAPAAAGVGVIELSGCKGEIESFQLIAFSKEASLRRFGVTFSNLLGPGGAEIGSDRFSVNRVAYIDIPNPSPFSRPDTWPDALMAEEDTELAKGNNPLWINLNIPREAIPGEYQGIISLLLDGKTVATAALKVRVFAFTLPKSPFYKSISVFRTKYIRQYCPEVTIEDCLRLFSRNRLGGVVGFPEFQYQLTEEGVELDTSKFLEMEKFYFDECNFNIFGLNNVYLGEGGQTRSWENFPSMSEKYQKHLGDYLSKAEKFLHTRKLADKVILYLVDEPWSICYDMFAEIYSFVKSKSPTLKTMLTEEPWHGGLLKVVDIWCSSYVTQPVSKRNIREHDASAFTYWNTVFATDKPAVRPRMVGWASDSNDIKGHLFWGICCWGRGDPFTVPSIYIRDNVMQEWSAGNGWLVYPSPDGKKLLSSIRFEILRDSFEDYDYLQLLRQHLASDSIGIVEYRQGKALLDEAARMVPDATEYPDAEGFLTMRNKIAEYLDKYSRD